MLGVNNTMLMKGYRDIYNQDQAAEREGDQVSVLRIIKYRDKVVSYLRSGKPRETIREYLTVLSNAERPKFLTEEQLFSYKNGQSSLASFKNGGSVG